MCNWLERYFAALKPATTWVTDIADIKTDAGKLYLCIMLELFNHRVVGWSMHHRQDPTMVIRAVQRVVWQHERGEPVISYSDRGSRYPSGDDQDYLEASVGVLDEHS